MTLASILLAALGFMLLLVFLIYPATPRLRNRLMWYDVALGLLGGVLRSAPAA